LPAENGPSKAARGDVPAVRPGRARRRGHALRLLAAANSPRHTPGKRRPPRAAGPPGPPAPVAATGSPANRRCVPRRGRRGRHLRIGAAQQLGKVVFCLGIAALTDGIDHAHQQLSLEFRQRARKASSTEGSGLGSSRSGQCGSTSHRAQRGQCGHRLLAANNGQAAAGDHSVELRASAFCTKAINLAASSRVFCGEEAAGFSADHPDDAARKIGPLTTSA